MSKETRKKPQIIVEAEEIPATEHVESYTIYKAYEEGLSGISVSGCDISEALRKLTGRYDVRELDWVFKG